MCAQQNPHYPCVYLCGRKGPNCGGSMGIHTHLDRRTIAMHNRSKYTFNSVCSQTQGGSLESSRLLGWTLTKVYVALETKSTYPQWKANMASRKTHHECRFEDVLFTVFPNEHEAITAMFAYQRIPPPVLRVATLPTEIDELN